MASGRGTTRVGVRTVSRTPVVEEIIPNSGWTEDPAGHYLLVDLPGIYCIRHLIKLLIRKELELICI